MFALQDPGTYSPSIPDNIQIVANKQANSGTAYEEFMQPMVYTTNKHTIFSKQIFPGIRKMAIVMGDMVEDTQMVQMAGYVCI